MMRGANRAMGGLATGAGVEFGMRRWVIAVFVGWTCSSLPAFAQIATRANPGVTHSLEGGEPIVTVRLVPQAEAQPAAATEPAATVPLSEPPAPAEDPSATLPLPGPEASAAPADAAPALEQPAQDSAAIPAAPESPEAALPAEQAMPQDAGPAPERAAAADPAAQTPRYPDARPVIKPDPLNGVGGALDLTPPEAPLAGEPAPMRLQAIDKPKPRAQREARRREARPPATPKPPVHDPLDDALPSVVVPAPAAAQPAPLPLNLSPAKDEGRALPGQ
jgi:hypothetical protein